jgi:hypothetical protein
MFDCRLAWLSASCKAHRCGLQLVDIWLVGLTSYLLMCWSYLKVNLVVFEIRDMGCGSASVSGFSNGISGHVCWCGEDAAKPTRTGPQQRD